MAEEAQRSLSLVRLSRAYFRLDDDTFAKQLLELFGASTEAARLAEPLLPDQELTVAQYVRQHLSYTVYLLSLAFEESPNLGYIVIPVARHLMTDQYLRSNYGRLEQVPNFPKSLISRLEQLDRETWFSQPLLGSHVVFDHELPTGGEAPSPVGTLSSSAPANSDRADIAKISTNEAPLSGQTHARVPIEPITHLVPGGRSFRRLEILRLLARGLLTVEEGAETPVRQHFSLPAYTYTHKEKSYLLLSPDIIADTNSEDPNHNVCTFAQFLSCRPDWWVSLSKDEKRMYIFEWMTCLAATVHFFHTLKISHGDIQTKRIFLVKNGKDIQIFLEGWHQSQLDPRVIELAKKRPGLKPNKSFGYGVPVEQTGSESRPPSRSRASAPEISTAEIGRLHDIKCLGDILTELLLVLLGFTKDSLNRQRRERLEWTKEMKAREGNGSWNPTFYPNPNSAPVSETSASSVASEMVEINIPRPGTAHSASNGQVPSKSKVASSDKPPKTSNGKDTPSRPGSLFGGMFSKSKEVPKVVEVEPPKPIKVKSYGIVGKMSFSGSSGSPQTPTWWLDELKLMYPPFQGAGDQITWNKQSDLIGNHLLLLISAMLVPEPALRPRAEAVWKDLTRIVNVFFKGTLLCCSAHDEHLKDARETLKENILDDIYRRGIQDEEEETWEGIGWDGPERFGPKRIGRRGEGALGECLF